jgi:acetyltransferase-like isoleucine patch superfamily enzyme
VNAAAAGTPGPLAPDHRWAPDELPLGVEVGERVVLTGAKAFSRLLASRPGALRIGDRSVMDGVRFSLGVDGRLRVGEDCRFSDAILVAEASVEIGDRVVIGWGATIADSDLHPVAPDDRWRDAEACSPAGGQQRRPLAATAPVVVGDDVYIGPNAAVLKGVRIGDGAFVEPGSVVVADVPPRCRVLGNPARVVEQL